MIRNPRRLTSRECFCAVFALGIVCSFAFQAYAADEKVLHAFSSQPRGSNPTAFIADASGNYFGATASGGAYNEGVVHEFSQQAGGDWVENVLHDFTGGADGSWPSVLTLDAAGNLYGETLYGGPGTCGPQCGVVFKLTKQSDGSWVETELYDFQVGEYPAIVLLVNGGGNLFGATLDYAGSCSVFELSPQGAGWAKTNLYTFPESSRCASIAGMVFDDAGNFFASMSNSPHGPGLVFELTPSANESWAEQTAFTFIGGNASQHPAGNLLFHQGKLYRTTLQGGMPQCRYGVGCGAVFE